MIVSFIFGCLIGAYIFACVAHKRIMELNNEIEKHIEEIRKIRGIKK